MERGGNCVERNRSERSKVASVAAWKPFVTGGIGGVAAGGGGPDTSFALLGYPRSRKNGGHIEAGLWGNGALKDGAQPSRFIARRATNGAPPSEATRLNGESGRRCGFRDRFGFVTVFKMGSTNGRR